MSHIERDNANLLLHSQRFSDPNAAHQVVLENCTGTIDDCVIEGGNTMSHARQPVHSEGHSLFHQIDGGGLLILGKSNVLVRRTSFLHNHAVMCGGAVSIQAVAGSEIIFEDCVFADNTADDMGPAIDVLTPGIKLILRRCKFMRNTSTERMTTVRRGQVTLFPGSVLDMSASELVGNSVDVDYHATARRPVSIITDGRYKIENVTGQRNRLLGKKLLTLAVAWAQHPTYLPRIHA